MHEEHDKIAAPRRTARGPGPLLRLFSSVGFGVTLLSLLLAYASVVSAVPQVRLTLEMTEMQAFRHWVFVTLVALFCAAMCVTTWRRIRWNLTNLGVLTVHSGLLLLAGGSAWYFGNRVEGSVLLRTPRLEVVQLADASRPLAEIPLEVGKGWAENLPNFGGLVALRVASVAAEHPSAPREATLQTRLGDGPIRELVVAAAQSAVVPLNDKLGVRIRTFPPEDRFYDGELSCLHYRRVGEAEWRSVPLPQLPIYRARFVDDGSRITDARGATVSSARQWPHIKVLGVSIPTGWIEHWRMPLTVQAPDLPFDLVVDGYLPYLRGRRQEAAPGGDRENPALEYTLGVRGRETREFLFALDPARSLSNFAPLEFRWVRGGGEEAERLLSPLAGPRELSIELKDPPLRQVVAVRQGQTIRLEGTSYELTIDGFEREWSLASPQLRGAVSPAAIVSVSTGAKKYQRTVIQRFPEYSQDIDESGRRHNDGPYDANLVLRYRTGADAWAMVVAGEGVSPELGVFQPDGTVRRYPLRPGERNDLGGEVAFTLNRVIPRAREVMMPVVEPVETRRPDMQRQLSTIRVRAAGRGAAKDWSESHWILHTECVHLDWKEPFERKSVILRPPGGEAWELAYGPAARPLGFALVPGRLTTRFFPGTMNAEWWRSEFLVQQDGVDRAATVETNVTFTAGRWTLFQSGADFDEHWGYTVLGVGNRQGIWPMVLGSILIPLGCLYAFYVKPVLVRRRKLAALAAAENRRPAVHAPEPVEVS